jgi:hypothetical protein
MKNRLKKATVLTALSFLIGGIGASATIINADQTVSEYGTYSIPFQTDIDLDGEFTLTMPSKLVLDEAATISLTGDASRVQSGIWVGFTGARSESISSSFYDMTINGEKDGAFDLRGQTSGSTEWESIKQNTAIIGLDGGVYGEQTASMKIKPTLETTQNYPALQEGVHTGEVKVFVNTTGDVQQQ